MSELGVIAPWIAAGAATVNTIFILVFGFLFNRRLEQVKSQLSLRIHVHRAKFEKEFQVLQEVWSCLVCLRNAGAAFTPGFKSGQSDESEDKKQFGQAYNDLLRTIDNHKPFFPPAIFDLLEDFRKRQFKYFIDHQFITRPDFKTRTRGAGVLGEKGRKSETH